MIKKCALWLRDSFIRNRSLNATRIVAGSFAAIILIGALLLTLPIASRDGQSAGFFTGLFTPPPHHVSADLVDTWTSGRCRSAVILTMIQLGSLGFMTVITPRLLRPPPAYWPVGRLIVCPPSTSTADGVVRVVRHHRHLRHGDGGRCSCRCACPGFSFLKGAARRVPRSLLLLQRGL
ncbi:MAG: hypothetical protein ACLS63_08245 [Flavonifractor plautii]